MSSIVAHFAKKVYRSIDELHADVNAWICEYNEGRPQQGLWCFGKTAMQTFPDAMPITKQKMRHNHVGHQKPIVQARLSS